MSGGFVKIYSSILDSSVWFEPDHVLRTWLALLALADRRGMVEASVVGLARRANVDEERCAHALERLMAPDPHSKTPEHEGRRIEPVRGGWFIFNYKFYRERGSSAPRVRAFRAKAKAESVTGVTDETPALPLSSSSSTTREGEAKRDVTPGNGVLAVGELVQQIKQLAVKPPQGAAYIPRKAVEAIGADVVRAYDAVGGSSRFIAAEGKDVSFLIREFGQALRSAREDAA